MASIASLPLGPVLPKIFIVLSQTRLPDGFLISTTVATVSDDHISIPILWNHMPSAAW